MKFQIALAVAASLTVSACAATTYTMTPHPQDGQSVRYVQGRPTIFAEGRNGAIQVTPMDPNEKGRLIYSVAALNRSQEAVNFGAENIDLAANGVDVRVFTVPELERMAKNDATKAMIAMALVGGVAAAAAASGPTSTSTTTTPWGTYHTTTTNHAVQAASAAAVTASTAASMNAVSQSLDATLDHLGSQVLQTTTIDPEMSYGGQVIGDRVELPANVETLTTIKVSFAGEDYVVNFGITPTT